MSPITHSLPTPRDVARGLFRHRRKSLTFFAFCVAATAAALIWLPRKYESECKLFVRVGRESVGVDPTAATAQTVNLLESRENEIATLIEILQSREILAQVVDTLGPGYFRGKTAPTEGNGERSEIVTQAAPFRPDSVSGREAAIKALVDAVSVFAGKKSHVITVRTEFFSPEKAQKITDTLVRLFISEHIRIHRTQGSQEFFSEQVRMLREQWEKAADALAAAQNELGVVSIADQQDTLRQEMRTSRELLQRNHAELAASRARLDALEKSYASLPERIESEATSGIANQAADNMQQELYKLQIKERELLSKYTPEHPTVISLRQQVAEAEQIASLQANGRTQTTMVANPARQEMELQLLKERANLASLLSQQAELESQCSATHRRLAELNQNSSRIMEMESQADLLENKYLTYADRFEQARIDHALMEERISNITVVQPASFVEKPSSPKKGLLIIVGLAAGVFGALALAYVAEQLDSSLKTPDDVERRLELPVLLSIPRTKKHVLSVT